MMRGMPDEIGQRAWVMLMLENQPAYNTARLCRILRERLAAWRLCPYGGGR